MMFRFCKYLNAHILRVSAFSCAYLKCLENNLKKTTFLWKEVEKIEREREWRGLDGEKDEFICSVKIKLYFPLLLNFSKRFIFDLTKM